MQHISLSMSNKECINQLSDVLFWDINKEEADMDNYPSHIIQRVLEYGTMNDWRILRSYYGIPKIAEECKQLRTLDPISLAYICTISHTRPEEYRCFRIKQ